jgi:hypothetical protein
MRLPAVSVGPVRRTGFKYVISRQREENRHENDIGTAVVTALVTAGGPLLRRWTGRARWDDGSCAFLHHHIEIPRILPSPKRPVPRLSRTMVVAKNSENCCPHLKKEGSQPAPLPKLQ